MLVCRFATKNCDHYSVTHPKKSFLVLSMIVAVGPADMSMT